MDYNGKDVGYYVPYSGGQVAGFVLLAKSPEDAIYKVMSSKGSRHVELQGGGRCCTYVRVDKENLFGTPVPFGAVADSLPRESLVGIIRTTKLGHRLAPVADIGRFLQ
ncbi:hypothetical protein HYU11_05665 [Candidatus Woesearchaeota archaeon]|nr:hypothetical protein [Candidatus Woesearchaeota archaeon]